MTGGKLNIEITSDNNVLMIGTAKKVLKVWIGKRWKIKIL